MNDEKDSDSNDQILQEVYFAHEGNEVSLFSNLFGIRAGGNREVWRLKGESSCYLENFEM